MFFAHLFYHGIQHVCLFVCFDLLTWIRSYLEHVLQAEAVRAEYEERIQSFRSQVSRLEEQLEQERIMRVNAEIAITVSLLDRFSFLFLWGGEGKT